MPEASSTMILSPEEAAYLDELRGKKPKAEKPKKSMARVALEASSPIAGAAGAIADDPGLIPMAGAMVGGAAAGPLGFPVAAALSTLGAGGGEALRQKVTGETFDPAKMG